MPDQPTSDPIAPTGGEIVPETEARQGRRGLHMLGVLAISIGLLVVIYLGIFFSHARPTADSGNQAAEQRTATATKATP